MKFSSKHFVAALSLVTVLAVAPTSAFARGSVHIDVPGLSIGVHDDHRYKRHRKHHRKHRRHYSNDYYYDGYRDRRYHKRKYRYNKKRYYNDNYYNDNYYYGGRRNDRRYYNRSRRVEVCPTYGYSRYYRRNQGCYEHKDHYHCS